MLRNRRIPLIVFLAIAVMAAVAIVFEDDLTVRFGIAALVTAYGGVTFHIVASEDQAEVRQRHHNELIAALDKIAQSLPPQELRP